MTRDALRPLEPPRPLELPRPLERLWRGLLVHRVPALGSTACLVLRDLGAHASPVGAGGRPAPRGRRADRGGPVVSHRTVQSHVQNTLRKLQLHDRVQLVRYAVERGLAEDPT